MSHAKGSSRKDAIAQSRIAPAATDPSSPPPPLAADGSTEMLDAPRPVPVNENLPDDGSEPDGAATPRPQAAVPANNAREPALTLSPTTSEIDQAGFYPVVFDRTRKHPGTPSDKATESDRRNMRSAAMREKDLSGPSIPQPVFKQAPLPQAPATEVVTTQPAGEITGGSILPNFSFPAFVPSQNDHDGISRTSFEAPSAPATAVHASRSGTTHASRAAHPGANKQAHSIRPPSPHAGLFTRTSTNSYSLSRVNQLKKNALAFQPPAPTHSRGRRGPSPSRAESSAQGAARRSFFPDFESNGPQPEHRIKQEQHSPFLIPRAMDAYYDSDEEQYLSPSEEKVLRELNRKRAAARAAQQLQRNLDAHGLAEVPPPAKTRAASTAAMSISSSSDSDSDSDSDEELLNGGIAINNPQASEEELAATAALHPALANSRVKVTTAGTRGPINGLARNHYWQNACPIQRQAILRAKGHKVLAWGIGIIGHPEIDPRDPAMPAFMNKTVKEMFGDDCRAFVTRVTAAVGAKRDEATAPDIFAITGLTAAQADFLADVQWLLAGALQAEFHGIDEPGSDHIYTASGAMVSKNRFKKEMIDLWAKDPEIRAIVAAHAAQKNISEAESFNILIASLDIARFDVILPRTPGVVTRQFVVNGGAHLSLELHRRLREAASSIVVDTRLRGRAEAWSGWHCIVCHSVTHPTGMCPSRILEGWAAAADEILRRMKEKQERRNDLDDAKPAPRFDDKRGGNGGGRNGKNGGGQGGRVPR